MIREMGTRKERHFRVPNAIYELSYHLLLKILLSIVKFKMKLSLWKSQCTNWNCIIVPKLLVLHFFRTAFVYLTHSSKHSQKLFTNAKFWLLSFETDLHTHLNIWIQLNFFAHETMICHNRWWYKHSIYLLCFVLFFLLIFLLSIQL